MENMVSWVGKNAKSSLPVFAICLAGMILRPSITLTSDQPMHVKVKTATREFLNEIIALPLIVGMTMGAAPIISKAIAPMPKVLSSLAQKGFHIQDFGDDMMKLAKEDGGKIVGKMEDLGTLMKDVLKMNPTPEEVKGVIQGYKQMGEVAKTTNFTSIIACNCLIPFFGNMVIDPLSKFVQNHLPKKWIGEESTETAQADIAAPSLDITSESPQLLPLEAQAPGVTGNPLSKLPKKNITASVVAPLANVGG